ncbi:MAG: histidinol phosphate phosphatase domain-containing protein [bacterium]|nr:histidinol phosphate phosphatase domain-containing protein [bacterium]MDD5756288.1 histidinol phosphate phosphatase domain-containing protein [bacterium]
MIDLHSHTFFSDGVLIPSELVCRAAAAGYKTICLSDHVDFSNIDITIPRMVKVSKILTREYKIKVIAGAELTYVPPRMIAQAFRMAKNLGAEIVLVHGETTVEPVPKGTNRAAIEAKVDILAHPGNISKDDVKLARANKVHLEITTRRGHNKTNKHVARLAHIYGAKLVFNTDTHTPEDLMNETLVKSTLAAAHLTAKDFKTMQENAYNLVRMKE